MTERTAGAVTLGPRAVLRFVLPSLASLLLFLVPFRIDGESTILVAELAAFLREGLAPVLPALILFIAGVSALASLVLSLRRRERGLLGMLFCVRWYWVVLRLAGALIAAMVLLGAGPEFLRGDSTGGTMVRQLVPNVMTLFLAVIFLLPLMTEYGIMEFTGVLLSRFFRRLFRLPGRGAIDAMASWLGAAPLGVLVTMQQYERGSYNRREALSIVSSFSLASVAFCLLIASILDITAIFLPFYGSVAIVSVVLAMVVCRLPPLSRVPETYHRESSNDEAVPTGEALGRWALRQAVDRAARAYPVATQVKHSAVRLLDLWFGLIPTVIAIGTLALALHTAGVLGRLFAEALENTPPQPADALRLAGSGRIAAFCYGTLPSLWPQLVAYTLYRWENNIRMASVLGFVGAGGLGQMLYMSLSLFQEAQASTVILAMLAMVLAVDSLSAWARQRWVRG